MKRRPKRPPSPVQPVNQLRVHRVDPGTGWVLRMLSDAYDGIFTHWFRGRSVYCAGEECLPAYHRIERTWRGYCAAEVYRQDFKKWQPTVLEITEALELELRGVYQRGQVWRLWRDVEAGDVREPVRAELLEVLDGDQLPAAFDIRPPLLTVYHLEAIAFGAANPRPAKVLMPLSDGPPPRIPSQKAKVPDARPAPSPLTFSELLAKRQAGRNPAEVAEGNGRN